MNGFILLGMLLATAGNPTGPKRDKTGTWHREIEHSASKSLEKKASEIMPSKTASKQSFEALRYRRDVGNEDVGAKGRLARCGH